jgi:tetratricopeptide (TPR) repeat protein
MAPGWGPDWGKVALAALTAAALGVGCLLDAYAQSPEPEEAQSEEAEVKAQEGAKVPPAGKKKQDPADARRSVDAAAKLLEAGKVDQAAQTATAALAAGNLPPPSLAKAFYVRGVAYRQQGKTAQAISDLTNALWLKGGLGGPERAEALKQRSAAYSDAGLTDSGEVAASAPAKSKSWWGGETASTGASSTGQAKGGWLGGLFDWSGSSTSASSGSPAPTAKAPEVTASIVKPEPPPAAKAPKESSSWASNTEVRVQPGAHAEPPDVPAPPAAKPPPVKAEGRFKVQLAAVRTQEEALAVAAKAKREYAAALAAREPEIDQAVFGNMGAFYRVRVGPFATVQETEAVCARLKGSGFDCMSVTR